MAYSVPANMKKNSVPTTIADPGVAAGDTSIPVAETSVFYDKDGALILKGIVIGYNDVVDTYSEEITITGASTTSGPGNLTGVVRGVNSDGTIGAARAWVTGTNIGVEFSIGIYNDLKNDIVAMYSALRYGYKELSLLQGIIPDNNAAEAGQGPELANGVNYAWASFNHSATQRLQFVVPMPSDWDGTMTAIFGWSSVGAGSGTVKWMLKGYRVGDNATLNATLAALTNATDTYLGASVMHVTAESSSFTPSGTGNLLLLEVYRDYANDTLPDAARFISLRLKYGRTV